MEKTTQFSVNLENKPGRLAELCQLWADAGINILAIAVIESTEQGIVRVVVDKTDEARKLLEDSASPCTESPVLLLKLKDEVGTMAGVANKLASSGVNISYVYGSAGQAGKEALLVLAVSDINRAERALSQ